MVLEAAKQNDKSNITIGRPKPGGAIYWAPAGTETPGDADASLGEEFINLGYVSEDGLNIAPAEETSEIVAWGGDKVVVSQDSYGKTATFNLLETIRPSVLQFMYGKENVVIGDDGKLSVADTGEPLPHGILVIETIQNNGSNKPRFRRDVFGDCQVSDRSGDHTFNNSDPVSYPITITAFKFASKVKVGKQVYSDTFWSKTSEPES